MSNTINKFHATKSNLKQNEYHHIKGNLAPIISREAIKTERRFYTNLPQNELISYIEHLSSSNVSYSFSDKAQALSEKATTYGYDALALIQEILFFHNELPFENDVLVEEAISYLVQLYRENPEEFIIVLPFLYYI